MSESKQPPNKGDGPVLDAQEVNTASSFAELMDRMDNPPKQDKKDTPEPPAVFSLKDVKEPLEVEEPKPEFNLNEPTPNGDEMTIIFTPDNSPPKEPPQTSLEQIGKTPPNEKLSKTFARAKDR